MSELRSNVAALIRNDLAQEASAGFPILSRTPCTQVVRFLDYWATLPTADQDALLDSLARLASVIAEPERAAVEMAQRQQDPALARLGAAVAFRGFAGGYRCTPIKILGGIAKNKAIGNVEDWLKTSGCSALELQLRPELLPSPDCIVPVKPARLKKLVDKMLTALFAPRKESLGSDGCKYVGEFDQSPLTVTVLFAPPGRQNPRQLQYLVNGGTYEGLWHCHAIWDYITEENAERSVKLLRDLVFYLVGFMKRVNELRQRLG
jgi:hypothetical protein